MDRINAIERVLDKRASRGASDKSLISWLEGLKNKSETWNGIIDGFVSAIRQTPRGGKNHELNTGSRKLLRNRAETRAEQSRTNARKCAMANLIHDRVASRAQK